jgi:hypothetical protein
MFPGLRNAASAGLVRFLAGFRFTTPLFVSDDRTFEVPYPADAALAARAPDHVAFHAGEELANGTFSHQIDVAIGTRDRPAPVTLRTGSGLVQASLWAPTLEALEEALDEAAGSFVGARGGRLLGGEPAVMLDLLGEGGQVVLAVHDGRAYVISAAGFPPGEPSPILNAFLDGFRFVER